MAIKQFAQRVLFSIVLISSSAAIAVPSYVYDGSVVTGISGIEIGASVWDVAFIDDSVDDYLVATGLSGPQFDIFQAQNMSFELSLVLQNDLPDLLTSDFNGCTTTTTNDCYIITLFSIDSTNGNSSGRYIRVQDTNNDYPVGSSEITDNAFDDPNRTLTFWKERATGVPEPSVLALISAGLFGVFGLARLRART